MSKRKLTEEEVALLNSKIGLHAALKSKKFNLDKVLERTKYLTDLRVLQEELIKLQNYLLLKK